MKKSKKMSVGKKILVTAGAAALAEGAYYLLGPKAKVHQKKAKILMNEVKKEIKIGSKIMKAELNKAVKKATQKPTKSKK
jgi:hypothetical protein